MSHEHENDCEICQVLATKDFSKRKKELVHELLTLEFTILDVMLEVDEAGIETDEDELMALMEEIDAVGEKAAGVTLN